MCVYSKRNEEVFYSLLVRESISEQVTDLVPINEKADRLYKMKIENICMTQDDIPNLKVSPGGNICILLA